MKSPCRNVVVFVLLLLGCGDDSDPATPVEQPPEACEPPNRVVGEACIEPGVQDNGCPAGTLGLDDGTCQPAGVPPELCAEGFVHDGDAGCEPILPPDRCPPGQMAVPGEMMCHPVMDCGTGRWGDIPVDGSTVYVDAAYSGGTSDGSEQQPFTSISAAVAAATDGTLIAIAAGTYSEDVVVQKRLRLWGVCPELVELVGVGNQPGALTLELGASDSEVHGLAVTGSANGISVSGSRDVLVAQTWVHDAARRGIGVESTLGPTSITLSGVLAEGNHRHGVFVAGSEAILAGVTIRGTLSYGSSQLLGYGLAIQVHPGNNASSLATVSGSVIEDNAAVGVFVDGSQATIAGSVMRGTLPQPSDGLLGRGMHVQPHQPGGVPSRGNVVGSLIQDNHDMGVVITSPQWTLNGVVIRGTRPRAMDQHNGRGVLIALDVTSDTSSSALIESSLIEDNHEVGVAIDGSQVTLLGVLVRGTSAQMSDQLFGRGTNVQPRPNQAAEAELVARGSVFEGNAEAGVFIANTTATLDGVLVRSTHAGVASDLLGDGVVVVNVQESSSQLASAVVMHGRFEDNARAGLSNFGSTLAVGSSALVCNGFSLAGETADALPYRFEDQGGNGCGCPGPTGACVVETSGLMAPEGLVDPEE